MNHIYSHIRTPLRPACANTRARRVALAYELFNNSFFTIYIPHVFRISVFASAHDLHRALRYSPQIRKT